MKRLYWFCIFLFALSALASCIEPTRLMRSVPGLNYTPKPDKAIVVFLRPQILALNNRAAIYELIIEENNFIGILSAKEKLAYVTEPGNHLFMITGESADFMRAELHGGRIYYVRVIPRIGIHHARFSLEPVDNDIEKSKLESWQKSCKYVENTKDSLKWAQRNSTEAQIKKGRYLPNWIDKPESEQPFLKPEYGFD